MAGAAGNLEDFGVKLPGDGSVVPAGRDVVVVVIAGKIRSSVPALDETADGGREAARSVVQRSRQPPMTHLLDTSALLAVPAAGMLREEQFA